MLERANMRYFMLGVAGALVATVALHLLPIGERDFNYAVAAPALPASAARVQELSNGMAAIAEASLGSVVSITVAKRERVPVFRFGDTEGRVVAKGSGVIMNARGYIITNYHVVAGATEIVVRLDDDRRVSARVVGGDPATDLAVIKIEAKRLNPARTGDSDKLRVGEWVLAIGSPFGLDQSVTHGIISAKGRSLRIAEYEDFIQTDAAINRGNSGGALVNMRGEVIGINTAIRSSGGGSEGAGFSIPINMALEIMSDIVTRGRVTRGWLGVGIAGLSQASLDRLKIKQGVLVEGVVPGSPADRGGLQESDVILTFSGEGVDSPNTLKNLVARADPGSKQRVEIIREGRRRTLTIELADREDALRGRGE